MSFLVGNIPPVKCFVKAEYLYNQERRHGELEPCVWMTVKSIKGQALRIESLLTNYGALYDKLPLSAYVWKPVKEALPLDYLQIWDCMSYDFTVVEKSNLRGLKAKFFCKDRQFYFGSYMFTVDFCGADHNRLDLTFTEGTQEHKSFNILKLDNGQFAAQPNNRCLFYDLSMVPNETKFPDFLVPEQPWSVESTAKWTTGSSWFYSIDERAE